MDPKQPTTLDPKLQEAYDRVMNSTPAQASPTTAQSMPNPSPVMPQPQETQMPQTPSSVSQAPLPPPGMTPSSTPSPMQQSQPIMTSMPPTVATPNINPPMNTTMPMPQKPQATTSVHGFVSSQTKKSSSTPSFLYVLAALVFFVVYTIFWLKFFKVSLPLPFLQ